MHKGSAACRGNAKNLLRYLAVFLSISPSPVLRGRLLLFLIRQVNDLPSQVVLEAKKQQVAQIHENITKACAGVIVDYKGISVADDTALRKELREAGVQYHVVKNTLLKLALDGTGLEGLDSVLEGTTALAVSEDDYTASARILAKFADSHKTFALKGGFLDGEVISMEKLDALAKLPTREVLLTQVACVFQAPMASFARVIKALADKKAEGAPAEDAPAAEAAAEAAPAAEQTEAPAAE